MARVILDIPSEKMHSFLKMVLKLGIDKHAISSEHIDGYDNRIDMAKKTPIQLHLDKLRSSFLLFDWEFFSNELEFE
ncbi:MAG: hypothetical protein J0I41_21675 [Filimonas sp.]|nr:hypothetical protein [Filimonas sp.]